METTVDEVGNVIIRKPATAGMENRKSIVLQSHLDMVCQKNNDVNFDFETEGIKMEVDGDWVKGKRNNFRGGQRPGSSDYHVYP